MEIKTKAMGTVTIVEKQVITLDHGFYGFAEYHSFALIDAEQKPFVWIQSIEAEELAFLGIDPFLFRPDYELDIEDNLLAPLDIDTPSDVLVFALITIPKDGSQITANLQGPLIINRKNNKAMQAILTDAKWGTKHDLVAEFAARRGV